MTTVVVAETCSSASTWLLTIADLLQARDRWDRQNRRSDGETEELTARVTAAEARAADGERRAAESDRRAAESERRAAESERRAAAMQMERDEVLLSVERERDQVAVELESIRMKARGHTGRAPLLSDFQLKLPETLRSTPFLFKRDFH